jgi:hypothetical protein
LISRRKRNNDTCVIRRNENISPVSSVLKTWKRVYISKNIAFIMVSDDISDTYFT